MHCCLAIDEILQNTVWYMNNNATCLNMALSCRAFYEPAMNVLWSASLKGLKPLILCLPEDAVKVSDDLPDGVFISRPPLPHEWTRFQHYARRVKEFEIQSLDDCYPRFFAEDSCFDVLRMHHPGPVFPRLRHLTIHDCSAVSYSVMFIQPTLKSLKFFPNEEGEACIDDVLAVLKCVESNAPDLTSIVIPDDEEIIASEGIESQLTKTLCSLNSLTTLDHNYLPLSKPVIGHLASLPALTSVCMAFTEDSGFPWTPASWGGFRSLRKLWIHFEISDTSMLTFFLSALSGDKLVELHVVFCTSVPESSLSDIFTAIARFQHLQKFGCEAVGRPWDEVIDGHILSPLFSIKSISSFSLEDTPIRLSRLVLEKMTSSWLHLKSLRLDTSIARISLEDLAILAGASRLHHVSAEIAPVSEAWSWTPPQQVSSRSSTTLRELCLNDCTIAPAAVGNIAAFLASVFPMARLLCFHNRDRPNLTSPGGIVLKVEEMKNSLLPEPVLVEFLICRLKERVKGTPWYLVNVPKFIDELTPADKPQVADMLKAAFGFLD